MDKWFAEESHNNCDERWRNTCEAIICQHYKSIYSFLAYLSGNRATAEDLTQETFLAAWIGIGRMRESGLAKRWLYKIAYRKFLDYKRRPKICEAVSEPECGEVPPAQAANPAKNIAANEDVLVLYKAICKLETSERLVIILHYVQGLSFRQMADILDEPTGTIKGRTSRSLKKLRELLTMQV